MSSVRATREFMRVFVRSLMRVFTHETHIAAAQVAAMSLQNEHLALNPHCEPLR